jgi:hypothetical protein
LADSIVSHLWRFDEAQDGCPSTEDCRVSSTTLQGYDWHVLPELDGEAHCLTGDALRTTFCIRLGGAYVQKYRQWIPELLFHEYQACKILIRFCSRRVHLHLNGDKVTFVTPARRTPLERNVNNEVRPDRDAMVRQGLLVFLLDDGITGQSYLV